MPLSLRIESLAKEPSPTPSPGSPLPSSGYHGLIPKLIFHNPDETAMLRPTGLPEPRLLQLVLIAGWSEIGFALILLVFWKARWPLWVVIGGMVGLTLGVAFSSPAYLTHAFDPLTLNLGVIALAVIALLTCPFDHS